MTDNTTFFACLCHAFILFPLTFATYSSDLFCFDFIPSITIQNTLELVYPTEQEQLHDRCLARLGKPADIYV